VINLRVCELHSLLFISLNRPDRPDPSCVSMKSDQSMDPLRNFNGHTDLG